MSSSKNGFVLFRKPSVEIFRVLELSSFSTSCRAYLFRSAGQQEHFENEFESCLEISKFHKFESSCEHFELSQKVLELLKFQNFSKSRSKNFTNSRKILNYKKEHPIDLTLRENVIKNLLSAFPVH